jgi:hypothetical protein
MKECPKCRQLFAYPNLRFCRFDGSVLNEVSLHEPPTLQFPTGPLHMRAKRLDEADQRLTRSE